MAGRRAALGAPPTSLLLLAAALSISSCSAVINLGPYELLGRQQNCWGPNNVQVDKQVPNPNGLTEAQCYQCVQDAAQTSTTPFDKTFGCWTYCQDNSTFMPTPAAADDCRQCIVSGKVMDPYACQTCIYDTCTTDANGTVTSCDAAARKSCYDCVQQYPSGQGSKEYYYACSHCAVLASVPQAYNHCTECVNKILTPNGQGILPTGWGDPYSPTQTPIPAYQFGKCVAEGQLIMAIVNGDEKPTGVQSLCFDAQRKYASTNATLANATLWRPTRSATLNTTQPPVGTCTTCVYTSYNGQFDPINTSPKSYGCAEYCMDPQLVHNEDQMDQCKSCITNTSITDPWGCQNCMAVNNGGASTGGSSANDETNRVARQKCIDCLTSNPYNNANFTNYPWACGQCAGIPDGARQANCYSCIQNKSADFPIFTSDQLCDCVDATVNAGQAIDRALDAFERSCLSNWTVDVPLGSFGDLQMIYLAVNGTLSSADLDALSKTYLGKEVYQSQQNPQWALHRLAGYIIPDISSNCLSCMATQKAALNASNPASAATDKRYACRQYCMDPQLILNKAQAVQCSDAVNAVRTADAWGVQNCLLASTTLGNYANTTGYPNFTFASNASALTQPADGALIQPSVVDSDTRDWCFRVLLENPLTFDSFPWAVGQCAQIKPSTAEIIAANRTGTKPFSKARADCEACLVLGLIDPCQCVELAQNPPDLPDVPVGAGGCTQPTPNSYLVPSKSSATGFTCAPCPDGTTNPNFANATGDQTPGPQNPNDRYAFQLANPNYYGVGKGFYFCQCMSPKTRQFPPALTNATSTGVFPGTGNSTDFQCLCPTGQWFQASAGTCNSCPNGTTLVSPLCSTSPQDCCACNGAANSSVVFDPTATAAPFCKCAASVANGYMNVSVVPNVCQVCPPGLVLPTSPALPTPIFASACMCAANHTVRTGDAPNYTCECDQGFYQSNGACVPCATDRVKLVVGNDAALCTCADPLVLLSTGVCGCNATAPNLVMDGTNRKCVNCATIANVATTSYDPVNKACICAAGHGTFNTIELTCLPCPDKDLDKFCNCPSGMKNLKYPALPQSFSTDCGCEANQEQQGKACVACDLDKEIDFPGQSGRKCICKSIKYDAPADQASEDKSLPTNNQCICKPGWWMDSAYRCHPCGYGKSSGLGSRGFDQCQCPPGSNVGNNETDCMCPKDTYMTPTGCATCPGNTHTQGRGATNISACGCHPSLVQLPAGAITNNTKCYCPKGKFGLGDTDVSQCQQCPTGATSDLGDDQRRSDYSCRCQIPGIMQIIRGSDDKVEADKNKFFCACPAGQVFVPNATTDAGACTNCSAAIGAKSCLGGKICGYKLFLEAFQPGPNGTSNNTNCTGRTIVPADVLSCWQQRARSLPGFVQQCTEEALAVSACSVKVALIFDTVDNLKAAVLYFRNLKPDSYLPYKDYFPDASFVNTCAKLPCGVQMRLYPDQAIPSVADFRPKSLLYTCGTAKYNDLPEGYTNMPSDALCIGTDVGGNSTVAPATLPCGCNTCPPNTFWQWDSTNSRYLYGGGNVGKSGKMWFKDGTTDQCSEFHGACCARFANGQPGRCPTNTCAGNEMGDNDELASQVCTCAGTCNALTLATDGVSGPKCTRSTNILGKKLLRKLLGAPDEGPEQQQPASLFGSAAGRELLDTCDGHYASADKGYCSDKKIGGMVTASYGAFCDLTVYGGSYLDTGLKPRTKYAMGRVACAKNGVKGSCASLYPGTDVAKVDGMDCFADDDADNWKLCNWKYNDAEKCGSGGNYTPGLPTCADTADWCQPGIWRVDRWSNGSTYGNASSWKQVSTGVDMCNPAAPGRCHGYCDITTGVCPTYSCSNPNAAHNNTNNLGPVDSFCAIQVDSVGNKYCSDSGKDEFGNDRDDTCPFNSRAQYASCVKYNTACNSATSICLGRVTCHTVGGTPTPCVDSTGNKLSGWDGLDCMLPISSTGNPKEFKMCGCSTPENTFVTNSSTGRVTKQCTKGSDGGKPQGDSSDDKNTDGLPVIDFTWFKQVVQVFSRDVGGYANQGCWQNWNLYRCWGDY